MDPVRFFAVFALCFICCLNTAVVGQENSTGGSSVEPCALDNVDLGLANVTSGAFGFSIRFPTALNNTNYNVTIFKLTTTDSFEEVTQFNQRRTDYKVLIYGLEPKSAYNVCITPYLVRRGENVTVIANNCTKEYCFSNSTTSEFRYEQKTFAIAILVTIVVIAVLALGSDIAYDLLYKTKITFLGVTEEEEETPSNTAFHVLEHELNLTEAKKEFLFQNVYRKDGTNKTPRPLVVEVISGREARMIFKAAKTSPYARLKGSKIVLTRD